MNMKKILLLGGSAQQVIAIKTAKRLGYYTVLCDFLPDNPGQYAADKFYLTSTTDKKAILDVAQKEQISGVLAYASDPAAPTAAYVAEKMNLPGNPYDSVEILCNKDRFRKFLSENGFSTPKARGYANTAEALADKKNFTYPVIVKPVDSSGSKGATVLHSDFGLEDALEFAFSFSRCHRVIVEDFIEKKHPYLIGGDIFVADGKVILWGLLNCHRDNCVNVLVPVGKSYPLQLENADVENVKLTLSTMVSKLGIRNGSMNVELVVDKSNRVWPIDVGPRSGGNMIPDLLGDMFGVDIAEMSIEVAMGKPVVKTIHMPEGCYATHNLHSNKTGLYKGIVFSDKLTPYIYRKCLYKEAGDKVEYFDNASKCLGIVFFRFPDEATMSDILKNINELITVELQ
jgi:biotin carboxylase